MESRIREAIAKIEVVAEPNPGRPASRGTGFLVGGNLVLTALHVVADRKTDPPTLIPGRIRLSFPGAVTYAQIVDEFWNRDQDWVLLRCEEKIGAVPIPIGDWQASGTEFETFGFPDANPRDGMVQSGTIENHLADLDGVLAYQLFINQAAAGQGASEKGLSGGPVIVENAVIGLMRFALMNRDHNTIAGTVYACPMSLVCEAVGALLPTPDPCIGLPGLPNLPLPHHPFRYLNRFEAKDAEIFFGRNKEIREICDQIISPDSPKVTLLFGQSGVGKSSFLDAGVGPRLGWNYDVRYLRRNPRERLLETLYTSLSDDEEFSSAPLSLSQAWRTSEIRRGKPLVVVLDQLEEVFTRPIANHPEEIDELCQALSAMLTDAGPEFRGRVVLAFRKEWFPELQKALVECSIVHGNVFLEELGRDDVCEVVTGLTGTSRLRRQYGLKVAKGLPGMIADDLVIDRDSPVAPVLQVLLTRMWQIAYERNKAAPEFSEDLYLELQKEGVLLEHFIEQQTARLRELYPKEVESGLALDVLAYHTTESSTAAERRQEDLEKEYAHTGDEFISLVGAMTDLYLLSGAVIKGGTGSTRLAHDTLATVVRNNVFHSVHPGQRARVILENRAKEKTKKEAGAPLDEWDLRLVEGGLAGMRDLRDDEKEILTASQQLRKRKESIRRTWAAVGIMCLAIIMITAVWAVSERNSKVRQIKETELARSSDRVARLLLTEPVDALFLAIKTASDSLKGRSDGNPGYRQQFSLNSAVNESWELYQVNHDDDLTALAMHPSGKLFASADSQGSIKLWRLPYDSESSGNASFTSEVLGVIPTDIACTSADIYKTPFTLQTKGSEVNGLAFNPQGSYLASVNSDGGARLWNLMQNSSLDLQGSEEALNVVRFSPDGNHLLAGGSKGSIYVWDVSGQLIIKKKDSSSDSSIGQSISSMVLSSDGKLIITGNLEGEVTTWKSLLDPEAIETTVAHDGDVTSLAPHPIIPNVFTSGGQDQFVHTWSAAGLEKLNTSHHSEASVLALVYRNDGEALVTGGADNLVRLLDVQNGADIRKLISPPFRGIDGDVTTLAVSPNGKYVVIGSEDNRVYVADWLSSQVDIPRGTDFTPLFATISADASSLEAYGTINNSIRYKKWFRHEAPKSTADALPTVEGSQRFKELGYDLIAVSADGSTALFHRSSGLVAVDLRMSDSSEVTINHSNRVNAVELDYSGRFAAIAHDQSLSIFDTSTGKAFASMKIPGDPLQILAFSRDGSAIAGASRQATGIWLWREVKSSSKEEVVFDPNDPGMFRAISFASERGLENDSKSQVISSLAVSNGGNHMAVGTRTGFLHLWHKDQHPENSKIVSIDAHNGVIYQTRFHPDGDSIITAGAAAIKLWNLTGGQLAEFTSHHAEVTDLEFSGNGKFAVSVGKDQAVRVWATHWRAWLAIGCERLKYHQISHSTANSESNRVEASARAMCAKYTDIPSFEHTQLVSDARQDFFSRIKAMIYLQ